MMATTNPKLITTIVEHKHPKPRYIAHYGGPQPVGDDVRVEVVFGDAELGVSTGYFLGDFWTWENEGKQYHVIAYRVLENDE